MNQDKRFELIARANKIQICEMAKKILKDTNVDVIKKPIGGMIMMRFVDTAKNQAFNLGEVLITEAEVRIGDNMGYAMMMGMEFEATLAGAILDAAVESGHPLSSEIIDLLRIEEERLKNELQKMRSKVNTTKVDFEAMM
ncbi:MAG: phosphonate C-P lyase system protein PhnG [Euryarchaeota archaeon]|nr:phosphonate C-P lyase system protein PhnG [Euryarchaeota archaeon]